MTNPYIPLLILTALEATSPWCRSELSLVVGPKRSQEPGPSSRRTQCGGSSRRRGPRADGRFPIKYYLTAMLFIVFDIESVFLYPFAVAFDQLGLFALIEMVTFIVTVFVAYAYVWRRGGLEWD